MTVVPKGSSAVTTPAQLKASVLKAKRSQRQAINQQIVKTRKAPANVVTISPGTNQGEAFGFFPANRSVPVGTAVTFKMAGRNEFHTVSFGPAAFLQAVSKTTFQGNGLAVAGEGSYPTNPPALGPPAVTPTANGNGFVSSGVLRDPGVSAPPPTSFTMVFPQPGVYKYICLIHTEMQGQITVG